MDLLRQKVNEKLKQKISEMDHDLPKLEKRLAEVKQKASNLVQAIAVGGLGSMETITAELQRLEQQKIVLTNEIQNHQVKQSSVHLTLEEAEEYVLKNNGEMIKYVLSRFIHKIIVNNEAIEVEYNLGGFFVEFKRVILIEPMIYSRQIVYSYCPLKKVSG